MKRGCTVIGLCLLSAGAGILVCTFLPPAVLVCVEALLLILAGLLCFKC
jgi:hypothetical protein